MIEIPLAHTHFTWQRIVWPPCTVLYSYPSYANIIGNCSAISSSSIISENWKKPLSTVILISRKMIADFSSELIHLRWSVKTSWRIRQIIALHLFSAKWARSFDIQYLWGIGSRAPRGYPNPRCSSPFYKMG